MLARQFPAHEKQDDHVIAREQKAPQVAFGTGLYWQLKFYGHDDDAKFDGGLAAWTTTGHKATAMKAE